MKTMRATVGSPSEAERRSSHPHLLGEKRQKKGLQYIPAVLNVVHIRGDLKVGFTQC